MKKLKFEYSEDNGISWEAPLTLNCLEISVFEDINPQQEITTLTGRKWENIISYIMVNIIIDYKEFDPAYEISAGAANAKWRGLFSWAKGKLKRISNANITCYPSLTGYTEFNTDPNLAYLVLEDMKVNIEPFEEGGDTKYVRNIELLLSSRDKV